MFSNWQNFFSFMTIMISKIILENIKIYAYHGVLPEEKILGTYYLINAEIHADLWKATKSDDLKDTINYALVNEIIHQEMKIPSQLLEHVIGRIMKRIAAEFKQVNFIKIKLTKVQPPMPGEMTGVSLEMERAF
ncbi:dihydroneopterin aldolase [Elizabethkingia occulta]